METRGMGARAVAMGGAYTAVADDVSATYYNPAGLAQIHGHRADFEYLFVSPRVYVRDGEGPARLYLDKWTKAPMGGLVVDLSRAIKLSRQIVVGWSAYFPDNTKSVYKVRYGTFYDPYFPLYGDSSADQPICLMACAGVEIFPWLLVGGGINLQIHGEYVKMDVAVDLHGEPVTEESRAIMDVTTEIHPLAGILLKPIDRLRIGFSWRHRVEFIVAGGMQMQMLLYLGPGRTVPIPIPLTVNAQGHYRPEQFALGASFRFTRNLLVAADVTYYEWHPYADEGANPLHPPMTDIFVPRVGAEYSLLRDRLALRAGYSFQESPLSPQRAGSPYNLMDNDVHTVSLGTGVFWDVFGAFPRPLQWSLFYQLQALVPRTFPNVHPGAETLTSSGVFHSFGFGFSFYF
jgi:long-chain fatty acid transport protein